MAVKKSNFKKSLKEPDEFITFSSRMLKNIVENKNKFYALAGGIVGIALLVLLFGYLSEKSANQALYQLNNTMAKYAIKDSAKAPDTVKRELQQLVDEYERHAGGKFAQLELANLYFKEGDYDQAITHYRKAAGDFRDEPLLQKLSKSGLGYSLEAKEAYEEAAECFEFVAAGGNDALADEALFALGRLYAALGDSDKQANVSKRLMEDYPNSLYFELVKEKTAQ